MERFSRRGIRGGLTDWVVNRFRCRHVAFILSSVQTTQAAGQEFDQPERWSRLRLPGMAPRQTSTRDSLGGRTVVAFSGAVAGARLPIKGCGLRAMGHPNGVGGANTAGDGRNLLKCSLVPEDRMRETAAIIGSTLRFRASV